jgi:hypothetical protein
VDGSITDLIIGLAVAFILIGGLNINGKQYGVGCSCDKGIEIEYPEEVGE